MNELVTLTDVQKGFTTLAELEAAAVAIKTKRNEGTIKAYALIIAHLENMKAKTHKRDKIAADTFEELLKMGVPKAKARRYIENAQAFRRHPKAESSGNPDDNLSEFASHNIETQATLEKWLFGEKTTQWYTTAVKAMTKCYETTIAAKGEIEAEKAIREMAAELQSQFRAELAAAMKKAGPVTPDATAPGRKSPSRETTPTKPKS